MKRKRPNSERINPKRSNSKKENGKNSASNNYNKKNIFSDNLSPQKSKINKANNNQRFNSYNKSNNIIKNNNNNKNRINNINIINQNKNQIIYANSDNLLDFVNEEKTPKNLQLEKFIKAFELNENETKNNYEKQLKMKDKEISKLQKELKEKKLELECYKKPKNDSLNNKNLFLNSNKKTKVLSKQKTNPKILSQIKKEELNKPRIEEFEKMEKENKYLKLRIEVLEKDLMKYQKSFNSPTLIGLNNIGATCFMNSTLQCLSQTKKLTNYFLNEKNKEKIINNNIAKKNNNELQLSPVYLELIKKLWDRNGSKSFSPNEFMNTIEKMNPLFKTGQAGDAKDFIIFILEQLHKELKMPVNFNNNVNSEPLNQYDKNNALNYFLNNFKKDCSIISDLFFGFNETTNECLNCKNHYNSNGLNNPICYNYGIFNVLIFPLEEVKNMKNSVQINNFFQMTNEVSLADCFIFNQKIELFTGENRNYCNICKQLFDSNFTSKIYISPNILILILNRGKGNIYNIKLNFSEVIDITQFVLQKDKPQINYILYGVITHIGQSGPNAHFVASCKSPVDDNWYRYNDSMVEAISDIQKEVINFGTPYILFYQKI